MYAVTKNILELTSVLLFIQVSLLHHRLDNYSFDRRSPKGFLEKKAWKISQNSSGDIFGDIRKGICHRCPLLGMFCKFPEQVLIKIITGTLAQGPLATFFWCLQWLCITSARKRVLMVRHKIQYDLNVTLPKSMESRWGKLNGFWKDLLFILNDVNATTAELQQTKTRPISF